MENAIEIRDIGFDGVLIVTPKIVEDKRGKLVKFYEKHLYEKNGINISLSEFYDITSIKAGTLRGIHYQKFMPQGKLLTVKSGRLYLVLVNLCKNSKYFGKWKTLSLNSIDKKMIWIPIDFGVASMTLEDNTTMTIYCSGDYVDKYNSGIYWKDSDLNINWPLQYVDNPIISDKDEKLPLFKDFIGELQ